MDAAAIEEANRMRATLGLKPLPVPGQAPKEDVAAAAASSDEDAPSTLESRQAKAYENYQKQQDAEAAKKRREERAAAVKKARDTAKRFAHLEGKGFGDEDEDDVGAKAWLMGQKKRQKKVQKSIKTEEELAAAKAKAAAERRYGSKDLAGIKVSHDISSFLEGDEQVLTLKDTTIQENEDEGDELEAATVRERERLTEKLDLKKKKTAYNPYDVYEEGGDASILGHYDEEIKGKKKKLFTLDNEGTMPEIGDILARPVAKKRTQAVDIDDVMELAPTSENVGVKVKKPKTKKPKKTRQKPADEGDMLFPTEAQLPVEEEMDIDSGAGSRKKRKATDDIVDDEDLQAALATQRRNALKKTKKTRPEDIARQLRENSAAGEKEEEPQGGLVIDDISEFVTGLKKPEDEERKTTKPRTETNQSMTTMDLDSDDERPIVKRAASAEENHRETSAPPDVSAIGIEEEKTVSQGMGAALSLLKERGLFKEARAGETNQNFRQHQIFLAEKQRRLDEFEEEARRQRERDRASGKLDRMSQREREEYARRQNENRDQATSRIMNELFRQNYKPQVELKYTDEYGRRLNEKEAFKHLSHQFHGKGSGKGKTDKLLKKIEDEKRRESQSMLDASQNVGMSSAAAQQLKKRKEAGVRLA
ncbi:hypothetical protein MKZ38_006382 [Zalerion maritima]|uniref:SART-1 protein n=1 Tax=Zalerion maritima TaxID=339359 RepID=A0AAD5WQB9_9PEZI|nr:hypothetical protein MKZ38_006382 [Zalerion maritima]